MQGPITRTLESAVDAASGSKKVVGVGRRHAPQRHIMNTVRIERFPHIAFRVMMLFERPRWMRWRRGVKFPDSIARTARCRSPAAPKSRIRSSAMPWVSCLLPGGLPNRPTIIPMIEFTAWPPSAGSPSIRITFRPRRAASIRGGNSRNACADDADVGLVLADGRRSIALGIAFHNARLGAEGLIRFRLPSRRR